MKCESCKKKNMRKANYCKKCGRKFTEEEKANAKKSGIDVILEAYTTVKDFITLDIFFDSKLVKAFFVLLVLGIGIYMVCTMGWNLRVLQGEDYIVKYNQEIDTYYVLIDNELQEKPPKEEVDVSVYVPNRVETLDLEYYDESNNLLETEEHAKEDRYTLTVNLKENNYYILSNHDKKEEKVKIYVYYVDYGEENEKEE